MIHVYYHSDPDGELSAAILTRHFRTVTGPASDPLRFPRKKVFKLHRITYGQYNLEEALIEARDLIYIVDLSSQIAEALVATKAKVVWIDHHSSSLASDVSPAVTALPGIRSCAEAACLLTWQFLYGDEEAPRCVQLIATYDAWHNKNKLQWDTEVVPFHLYALSHDSDPKTFPAFWENWLNESRESQAYELALVGGRSIKAYNDTSNRIYNKRSSLVVKILEHPTILRFAESAGSILFDSIWNPKLYKVMARVSPFSTGGWGVSLYGTPEAGVNVREIAEHFGGGGHDYASGFHVKSLQELASVFVGLV